MRNTKQYLSHVYNFTVNGKIVATVPALLRNVGTEMFMGKDITIKATQYSDGADVGEITMSNWSVRLMTEDQLVNVCLTLHRDIED